MEDPEKQNVYSQGAGGRKRVRNGERMKNKCQSNKGD
jgi:hypothetical protein